MWTSFLVVGAVFGAFSGAASVWGRLQRRQRRKLEANWRALLQSDGVNPALLGASPSDEIRRSRTLPPDPTVADSPSFATDSDSRRAALDAALERMSSDAPVAGTQPSTWATAQRATRRDSAAV